MSRTRRAILSVFMLTALVIPARAEFDLALTITSSFTPTQLASLQTSLENAESLWERVITGYQPGISVTGVTISVESGSAFAETVPPVAVFQGGYLVRKSGKSGGKSGTGSLFHTQL